MRIHRRQRKAARFASEGGRLAEEIAVLERRLAEIGPDGDCGYEKAMIRFFHEQIDLRRQQMADAP